MSRGHYQATASVADAQGVLYALANVQVSVYEAGTMNLVPLYLARTGSAQVSNPQITAAGGLIEFYADLGEYEIEIVDLVDPPRIQSKRFGWNALPKHAETHELNGEDPITLTGTGSVTISRQVTRTGIANNAFAGRNLTASDFTMMGLSAPIGLWNFNNNGVDASGNALDLAIKGSVSFVNGITGSSGQAVQFNGNSANALYRTDTGASDPLRIRTGSWGCWFKTAKRGTQQTMIGKCSGSGTTPAPDGWSYWLAVSGGNNIYAIVSTTGQIASSTVDFVSAIGTNDVADGRWHFAVATYNGALLSVYVDGELEVQTAFNGLIAMSSQPFNIGSYEADGSTAAIGSFYGTVDEAFVTSDVLSDDQVRMLYATKIAHEATFSVKRASLNVRRYRRGALLAASDFPSQPLRLHNIAGSTGAEIWDDLGSGNADLTPVANATAVTGPDGLKNGAVQFDSGGNAHATDTGLPSGTATRSYGLWIKTGDPSSKGLLCWGNTPGSADARMITTGGGAIASYNGADAAVGTFVCDGKWHFVVSVEENAPVDGVKRKLYLDGALVASSTVLNSITLGGATKFRIGSNQDGSGAFNGAVARAFVHNVALTPEQVMALYNKGSQDLGLSPKDPGAHVERIDDTNIYFIGDPLDGQHNVEIEVIG